MASKENPALGEGGASERFCLAAERSEDKLARTEAQAAVERHGDWLVIGGDTLRKRCVCKCARCAHVCMIGREALEADGVIFCAGCDSGAAPTRPVDPDTIQAIARVVIHTSQRRRDLKRRGRASPARIKSLAGVAESGAALILKALEARR
jgi:hypothetical protein